jgi:hypothetical protein
MAFHVAERYPGASIWINDADTSLWCFWRVLQDPLLCSQMIKRLHALRELQADKAADLFKTGARCCATYRG